MLLQDRLGKEWSTILPHVNTTTTRELGRKVQQTLELNPECSWHADHCLTHYLTYEHPAEMDQCNCNVTTIHSTVADPWGQLFDAGEVVHLNTNIDNVYRLLSASNRPDWTVRSCNVACQRVNDYKLLATLCNAP